jgi:hypothetical protein
MSELASILGALAAGLAAGAAHALLGPDHLAAVAPLSVRSARGATGMGLRWGLGHALGALVLGAAAVLARDGLPWSGLSAWAERAVGGALVLLGLWTLRCASRTVLHAHRHAHGGEVHAHVHLHAPRGAHGEDAAARAATAPATATASAAAPPHAHGHAALGIGFLHGLAGFGHLWAALPALALPRAAAIAYLSGFGGGTLLAMSAFAFVVGRVALRAHGSGTRAVRALMGASGAAAVAVGVWWLWGSGV